MVKKILSALIVSLFFLGISPLLFPNEAKGEFSSYEESYEKAVERAGKAQKVLKNSYQKLEVGTEIISEIENRINPLGIEIGTFKKQLRNIDQQYAETLKNIEKVIFQVEDKKIEIADMIDQTDIREIQLGEQQKAMLEYGKLLYQQRREYFDFKENKVNTFKLLLANAAISDVVQKERYLTILQGEGRKSLTKNEKNLEILTEEKESLGEKKKKLDFLMERLDIERRNLEEQKRAKERLIEETMGIEGRYQDLLEEARKEQKEILGEVEHYQNELEFVESQIRSLKGGERTESTLLSWPVDPGRGITAYFHDPAYERTFGMIHNAIDVRAAQETPIHAAANGYVYKVHRNDEGYSYLILAHENNIMTVYGHIYEFLVEEEALVRRGDVIALSGGTPGTKGAGWLTTGPHLHFEVYKNGQHVNPLLHLPVSALPEEYIPDNLFKK